MPADPRPRSWLAEARRRAGLTQLQLAERLGVPQSRVADWERGARGVPDALLESLAEALTVEPAEIEVAQGRIPTEAGELAAREPGRIVRAIRRAR